MAAALRAHHHGHHGHHVAFKAEPDDGSDPMDIDSAAQSSGTTILEPPVPLKPRDTIEAVKPFSGPYKSRFIKETGLRKDVLDCLSHVNCSYVSSGVAPSLLQLKQHAQSLTVLIREMTADKLPTLIDNEPLGLPGARMKHENDTYDWLNDLNVPYESKDQHHLQPLTSILNTVETSPVTGEDRNICPLQKIVDEGPMVQVRPYATRESLIQHADEILSRLDHEYSARGGLLSILPPTSQAEDRAKAEETVLGQMIIWMQNLVRRVHSLERLYANAMDLLAKEAVVPTEMLSALGTRGRKGREVVYPQDKFVLANAGDDLWDFLNAEFERKEVIDTEVDKNYRSLGATGEAIWAQRGGKEFARGITAIDVYTRYYRLRDNPLKTIFVIPAYEIHPGTKVTREIEQQPTVVSVVKPVWPERMSVIETKHKGDMADLARLKIEENIHKANAAHSEDAMKLAQLEIEKLQQARRELTRRAEDAEDALKQPANQTKAKVHAAIGQVTAARLEAAQARGRYEKQAEDTKKNLEEAKEKNATMQATLQDLNRRLAANQAAKEREWNAREEACNKHDREVARAAVTLVEKLKKIWTKHMTESYAIIAYLNSPHLQLAIANAPIPDDIRKAAQIAAKEIVDNAARDLPTTVPEQKQQPELSTPTATSFRPGWLRQGSGRGSLKKVRFTDPGKIQTGSTPSASPTTSMKSPSSSWMTTASTPEAVHLQNLDAPSISSAASFYTPSEGRSPTNTHLGMNVGKVDEEQGSPPKKQKLTQQSTTTIIPSSRGGGGRRADASPTEDSSSRGSDSLDEMTSPGGSDWETITSHSWKTVTNQSSALSDDAEVWSDDSDISVVI